MRTDDMKNSTEILEKTYKLIDAYRNGMLGGEKLPEDENPRLKKGSLENYFK